MEAHRLRANHNSVDGAAQATESVLGGVVHAVGSVIGALLGSGGEEAKWIWADAGKVSYRHLMI